MVPVTAYQEYTHGIRTPQERSTAHYKVHNFTVRQGPMRPPLKCNNSTTAMEIQNAFHLS